jgi:hypothetical protein
LTSITADNYIFNSTYKLLSFLPVFIILSKFDSRLIFWGAFHSLSLSVVISLFLLIFGFAENKFITYFTPDYTRFAALTIEPGSFAKGTLIVYFFYVLSFGLPRSLIKLTTTFLLIPTFSTNILLKLFFDYFAILRANKLIISFSLVLPLILYLFFNTRFIDSFSVRFLQYSNILSYLEISFFGSGFYLNPHSAAIPGFFRVIVELGLIFSSVLFFFIFYLIILRINFFSPVFLIPVFLPLIFEDYGAPFNWLCAFSFLLFVNKRYVYKRF